MLNTLRTTGSNGVSDVQRRERGTKYTFDHAVQSIKNGQNISETTQNLLAEMTRDERLSMLGGKETFWKGLKEILSKRYNQEPYEMSSIDRLGIPGVHFTDGPRGVVTGESTAFPVAMARGATWDIELERRVGNVIGLEAKAHRANFFAGICVNLPRHPAWGRIQETFSEDPYLLGEFGLALTRGVQGHTMTCVKHFALNSMENARFRVNVDVDVDVLHEVYLPHFKKIIDGGVTSVMSAYNSVRGEWCGQSKELLTHVLREQWQSDVFTISDFIFGVRHAAKSVVNGLDLEAPFAQVRHTHLSAALESGDVSWSDVDKACSRLLYKQLQFAATTTNPAVDMSVVFCQEHRALAREVATRSMTLLKNDQVTGSALLPLQPEKIRKLLVVGRLANAPNIGDKGSSRVYCPEVITYFEGLRAALPQAEVILEASDTPERAAELASTCDIVICVVGYDARDEGEFVVPSLQTDPALKDLLPPTVTDDDKKVLEAIRNARQNTSADTGLELGLGGDRRSLRLRSKDTKIIAAVTKANPNTIACVVAAGAVIMEEWKDKVPALLMSWYSGSEGGHALADVLLGKVDASGRLPFSIPMHEDHLPPFDMEATQVHYDRWHGQHLLDKLGVQAAFPFGFGLSYTTFSFSDLAVVHKTDNLQVSVKITNTGARQGRHIVQVYALPMTMTDFPKRVIVGFRPVDLASGESKVVEVQGSLDPLKRYVDGRMQLIETKVQIEVASYAGSADALRVDCAL